MMSPSAYALELSQRLQHCVPGGCHTYAKGNDQFPEQAPLLIKRGFGCHVWDIDDREFIEYGMGLRAVTLGHAFQPVIDSVYSELKKGVNFTRPSCIELECADQFLELISTAEMVKFCKNGSDAVDGALRLARAYTGRDMVAICSDHPFFSTGDWFIGTTDMNAGIPEVTRQLIVKFKYNDVSSLEALFKKYPKQIACVIMEAARIEEPIPNYLETVKNIAHTNGALLIFDEMITGFRWHLRGAQFEYGVTPDLSTFGKGLANGFSVSALAGRSEIMCLGGNDHNRERVFLLSTTHGAETCGLAAMLATLRFYRDHPVIDTLYMQGNRLHQGFERAAEENGLIGYIEMVSRDCNLLFGTRDANKIPSQLFRTLFLQEMIKRGVIAPSFVVSFSHSDSDIDYTIQVIYEAMRVYRKALEYGVEGYLEGRAVKPVFRKYA